MTGTNTMQALVTLGQGGYEQMVMQTVPRPVAGAAEVLLQVLAAGVNNTDINTRLGWYDTSVLGSTAEAATEAVALPANASPPDQNSTRKGWRSPTPFPLIQGADCCGRVVATGDGVDAHWLGQRVLVRPCMRVPGQSRYETHWLGTDFNGAFAQYVKVPVAEVLAVQSDWSDTELASIPCAYGTAENLLHRAQVAAGEVVLVTGASGGVGSAAVQLAKRRGAVVWAIASQSKHQALLALGADRVIDRDANPLAHWGAQSAQVVIDTVAGPGFGALLQTLQRGGRYATSGAIAGPMVALDMRTLYLNDLSLLGCTAWDESVLANLVAYIQRHEIKPLVAQVFGLDQMALAQQTFLSKQHVGKLVVVPPA